MKEQVENMLNMAQNMQNMQYNMQNIPPPCPSWQGESRVQSFDLDCVGSIPAIPPTQFTCFVDHFNKLE